MGVKLHDIADVGYHPLNAVGVPLAVYQDETRVAVLSDRSVAPCKTQYCYHYEFESHALAIFERRTLRCLTDFVFRNRQGIAHVALHPGGKWYAIVSGGYGWTGEVWIGRGGRAPVKLLEGSRILDCAFNHENDLMVCLERGELKSAAAMRSADSATLVTIPPHLWSSPPSTPFRWRGDEAREDWPDNLERAIVPRKPKQRPSGNFQNQIARSAAELHTLCQQYNHPPYPKRWACCGVAFYGDRVLTGSSLGVEWWSREGEWLSVHQTSGWVTQMSADDGTGVLVYSTTGRYNEEIFRLHAGTQKPLDSVPSEQRAFLFSSGEAVVFPYERPALLGPGADELTDVQGPRGQYGDAIASGMQRAFAVASLEYCDVLGEIVREEGGGLWRGWLVVDSYDYDDMSRGEPVRVLMTEPGDASSDIVISQTSSDHGTQINDDIFRGIRRWRPGELQTLKIRDDSYVIRTPSLVWSRDEIILRALTCVADHGLLAVVAGTELLLLDAATGVDVLRKDLGAEAIAVAARGNRLAVTTRMGTLRIFELRR